MPTCPHMKHRLGLRLLRHWTSVASCDRFSVALHTSTRQPSSTANRCPISLPKRRYVHNRTPALLRASNVNRQYSTKAKPAATKEARPLDEQLWAFYHETRASQSKLDARQHAVTKIQRTMDDLVRHQGLEGQHKAEMLGTVSCSLDLPPDELELTVIDPLMPYGWRPMVLAGRVRQNPLYNTSLLGKTFKEHVFLDVSISGGALNIKVKATAPGDPPIRFELTFNSREELQAARLIGAYVALDERVAPMVVFMSEWFNQRRLSEIKERLKGEEEFTRQPFSRTTIALLVVAYLQVMRLLPNLQSPFVVPNNRVSVDKIADRVKTPIPQWLLAQSVHLPSTSLVDFHSAGPEIWWHSIGNDRQWRAPADLRFLSPTSYAVQEWCHERKSAMQRRRLTEPTLAELVQGFFQFWYQFDFVEWGVSVRDGGVIKRLEHRRDLELEEEIKELGLGRYNDQFMIREDITPDLASKIDPAGELLLQVPVHPYTKSNPVLVLKPFQSSASVKVTPRNCTRDDRANFVSACEEADKAIREGKPLNHLLLRPKSLPVARKRGPPRRRSKFRKG